MNDQQFNEIKQKIIIGLSNEQYIEMIALVTETLTNQSSLTAVQQSELLSFRGTAYFEVANLTSALSDVNSALELNPDNIEARILRGQIYIKEKNYSEAIKYLTAVINKAENSNHELTNEQKLHLYYYRSAAYNLTNDTLAAIIDVSRAIELFPNNIVAQLLKGEIYIKDQIYPEAIKTFTIVIEKDKNNAKAFNFRGVAYTALKKYDEAIADFSKAITLEPENALFYSTRALCYFYQRNYTAAKNDIEKAVSLAPGNPEYIKVLQSIEDAEKINKQEFKQLENQLIVLINEKQYSQVLDLIDNTLKNKTDLDNTQLATMYFLKGDGNYQMKNYGQAIADFSKAIELDPNFAKAYKERGNAYFELKNYTHAINDYNTAIELDPDFADPYNGCGAAQAELKQYDKAIANLNKAIELDPESRDAYFNRGNTYLILKQSDEALADFSKAIELNPNFAKPYSGRGTVYAELKQSDEAIADFSKAIELDPNFATAYHNRGFVYFSIQNLENAKKDFRKSLEIDGQNVMYINALQAVQDAEKRTKSSKAFSDTFSNFAEGLIENYSKRIVEIENKRTFALWMNIGFSLLISLGTLGLFWWLFLGKDSSKIQDLGWSILPMITSVTLITIPLYLIVLKSRYDSNLYMALSETIQDKKELYILVASNDDKVKRHDLTVQLMGYYERVSSAHLISQNKLSNTVPNTTLLREVPINKKTD